LFIITATHVYPSSTAGTLTDGPQSLLGSPQNPNRFERHSRNEVKIITLVVEPILFYIDRSLVPGKVRSI